MLLFKIFTLIIIISGEGIGNVTCWSVLHSPSPKGDSAANIQFNCSVVFNSLWPHGLQHTRLPGLSPTPRVYSNSCLSSQSCHSTISSCRPLLFPPSIFPSIRVFFSESVLCIRWPKYWSFSFSISPSNVYSRLISFRMDWLDLLAVQGTFKSLLLHHSSKPSILQCSAFFMVQLSHPNMTTGKIIALTKWTFVSKVMSLFFNMLSNMVCHSFSSKEQVSFNFMAAVTIWNDFGAQENKVCHCFHCFPIYLPWSDGTRCHDISFLNVEF